MRRPTPALLLLAIALAGCDAAGQAGGTRTWSNPHVPFTFRVPTDFTNAAIDQGDTRGTVVGATGLTKVDVVAVRRASAPAGGAAPVAHRVQGHDVRSELWPVPGWGGWALECQYTPDFARRVRTACRAALASVARR